MKTFAVIGLGLFGQAVAKNLYKLGNEVTGIDMNKEIAQSLNGKMTTVAAADARKEGVLRELAVNDCDCAVVAVGGDVGTSALITLSLKKLGVKNVVCKAQNPNHQEILLKVGADRVVLPEDESGTRLAFALSGGKTVNFTELSEDAGIVEIPTPRQWGGQTLQRLDVRRNYGVNIIGIRPGKTGKLRIDIGPDTVVESTDYLVLMGLNRSINKVQSL